MVLATSTVLAVAKPGDLGDEDTDTEVAQDATTSTTAAVTTSTAPDASTTTVTTAVPSTTSTAAGSGATTSTTAGSGLGDVGSGNVRGPDDGTAETGMESMLLPGLALFGLGLAARRVIRTDPA